MLEVEMLEVEMDVSAAARALKRGEIVGVPTDTVYGIAVDPFDEAALDRLYDLKGRKWGNRSQSSSHPLTRGCCWVQCLIERSSWPTSTGPALSHSWCRVSTLPHHGSVTPPAARSAFVVLIIPLRWPFSKWWVPLL